MNKKILIIIGITLILVLVILLFWKPENKNNNKIGTISVTPTITITRIDKTGGIVPDRTPDEEKAAEELTKLRLAAPIDTGDFIISMNWSDAIFEVKAKDGTVDKIKLWDWLRKNGYESITADNFKFIE